MSTTRASLVIAVFAMCASTCAFGQKEEEVLTNADIVTLMEAGLEPSAIVAVIELRQSDFGTSVSELASLSRVGLDSTVIETMIRSSSAGRRAPAVSAAGSGPSSPVPQPVAVSTPALQAGQSFSDALSSGG